MLCLVSFLFLIIVLSSLTKSYINFLYSGQTGSGKTFTMLDERDGLYVLAARDIFETLKRSEYAPYAAYVSFYEIYQSQLYDLLNDRKKLFAREDGKQQVCISGLTENEVDNVPQLMEIFEHGNNARSTGATGANSDSSRSHAILTITLKNKQTNKPLGKEIISYCCLCIIFTHSSQ